MGEKVWWRCLKKATHQITVTNMLACIKPENRKLMNSWANSRLTEYRSTIINFFNVSRLMSKKKSR